jgi:hypothetical protein
MYIYIVYKIYYIIALVVIYKYTDFCIFILGFFNFYRVFNFYTSNKWFVPVKIWIRTHLGAIFKSVTGNLVDESSALRIEFFNGV